MPIVLQQEQSFIVVYCLSIKVGFFTSFLWRKKGSKPFMYFIYLMVLNILKTSRAGFTKVFKTSKIKILA